MVIKIIGAGCPACQQLEADVRVWITQYHITAQVERTDDLVEILNHHLTALPGLIVDDQLLLTGCPTKQQLDQALRATLQIA
jgi:hypothetical protein